MMRILCWITQWRECYIIKLVCNLHSSWNFIFESIKQETRCLVKWWSLMHRLLYLIHLIMESFLCSGCSLMTIHMRNKYFHSQCPFWAVYHYTPILGFLVLVLQTFSPFSYLLKKMLNITTTQIQVPVPLFSYPFIKNKQS